MPASGLSGRRVGLDLAGFLASFVVVAWWSDLISDSSVASVWRPLGGLVVAVVVLGGRRFAVLSVLCWIATALLVTDLVGGVTASVDLQIAIVSSLVYVSLGFALRSLGFSPTLKSYRDIGQLLAAGSAGALLTGLGIGVVLEIAGTPDVWAVIRELIGAEAVGFVSVAPASLLLGATSEDSRSTRLLPRPPVLSPVGLGEVAANLGTPVVAVFILDDVNVLFLAALPFLFTASRRGQPGAALTAGAQTFLIASLIWALDRTTSRTDLVLMLWFANIVALVVGQEIRNRFEGMRTERQLLAALQGSTDMVFVVDARAQIRWLNTAAETLVDDPSNPGSFVDVVVEGQASLDAVADAVRDGTAWSGDSEFRRRDGSVFPTWVTVSPDVVVDVVTGYSIVARDMTEQHRLTADLTHRALYDDLTGVANRSLLAIRLDHATRRIARSGEQLAVLLIDLDRFKVINDSLGHAFGDEVLVAVVKRLEQRLRSSDTLARLGGDEFCVVAEGLDSMDAALALADDLVELLGSTFHVNQRDVVLGASIGVVQAAPGDTSDELLRRADLAMYDAKASGGGRRSLFDATLAAEADRRLAIENHLRNLFTTDVVEFHIQPLVGGGRSDIYSGEALLRIRHPDYGMLDPVEVLGVIRDAGLVADFTRASIRSAVALATQLPDHFRLGVNLSPDQLHDTPVVELLDAAFAEFGVAGNRVVIEVTEDAFLEDADAATETLQALRALGCRIVLDDFGSGWSSLAMLQRVHFDSFKLDRSLVADIETSSSARSILETMAGLASRLGLTVVAEGVENAMQAEIVIAAGADWIQGYWAYRPMPLDELLAIPELSIHDLADPIAAEPTSPAP